MRNLAGGAGLSILVGLVAATSFRDVGGEAEKAEKAEKEPGADVQVASPGSVESTDDDTTDCGGGERLLDDYVDLYGDTRFGHLIVLAPDPVESGGTDLFEFVLEGVEEAVSSEDKGGGETFVHDHRWLPWTNPPAAARCWERQPGVIVYRPLDGQVRQPLMVLVVGETPTWGLRGAQFRAAIDLIRRRGDVEVETSATFRVLGPTYSGTAASLSAAISQSIPEKSVRIVSGTATTVKAREILVRSPTSPAAADVCDPAPVESQWISYESATLTDTCLLKKMEEFLVERGGKCAEGEGRGNIVLFTETSTTYGSAGTRSHGAPLDKGCFRRWKLPPDLASIRKSSAAGAPAPGPAAPGEATGRRLSPASVAVHAQELSSTLDMLSNGGARFAGILATDPRDVIFLAQRFREQLPDIRLFTLGASMQYLAEGAAPALNGMLIVHSAPRARDRNGEPSRNGPRSMSLQNELVRKIYFAARRLLARKDTEHLKPDVHVSFVGNGRLWTIDDFAEPLRRDVHRPPVGWKFAFAFFCVVLLAVVVVVGLGRGEKRWRPRGRLWALVAPCAYPDLRARDCAIGTALILVCAGPPILMLASMIAREDGQLDGLGVGVCVGASFLAVVPMWTIHIAGLRARIAATADRWCLASVPMVATTVVVALALYAGCGTERWATFHLLSGGSPVLVGLIAMSSYALALWCARLRLRMLDMHRFDVPAEQRFVKILPPIAQALGEEQGSGTGLADIEGSLLKALNHPWKAAWLALLAVHVLLLVTFTVPICIKPPHTLEPGWRNDALVGLGIAAALPMSFNLAWLLTTWMRFLRLLRRLSHFPAIAALARLPGRRARPLEQQLAWSGSEATQLLHAVDTLGRLAEVHEAQKARYDWCRKRLDARLSAEARDEELQSPEPATSNEPERGELVDELLKASAEASHLRKTEASEPVRARIDEFAASLIDLFIPRYVQHFRLFAPPMVLGCLCSVFLASLYFVQPQRLIASVALFWVAATVAVGLAAYVSLRVDPVLRAVGGSAPGDFTSRFALARKVAAWAAVPVAGYLAVGHPEFPLWVSTLLDVVGKSLR